MKKIHILLLSLVLLNGCGKNNIIDDTTLNRDEVHKMSVGSWSGLGTDDTFYGKSYTTDGYYQISGNLMEFTAYDTGKTYVLCAQTNCKHDNTGCSAWVESGTYAKGLAQYREAIYIVDFQLDRKTYILKKCDLSGENKKIILEIPCGDNKKDGWQLSTIDEVYYCNDIAWCSITYDYIENGEYKDAINQCVGYRLDNGEKMELTELSRNHAEVSDPYSYKSITERFIGIQDIKDYSLCIYDVSQKQMNTYEVKDMQKAVLNTGLDLSAYPLYDIRYLGSSDETGLFYFQVYVYADEEKEETVRNVVFSWNLQNEVHIMTDFGAGGVLFESQGGMNSNVWREKEILYAVDQDSEKTQIVRMDLLTGNSTPLFVDENIYISFRVMYDCDDFYVGTLDDGDTLCKIDKNAYDRGDFSQAVKIKKLGAF